LPFVLLYNTTPTRSGRRRGGNEGRTTVHKLCRPMRDGVLPSLATLSLRPALQRPADLPGGQPPGSADARFVRQATVHLCDTEGLAQLVTVASEVPTSGWEDPATLKPALAAAHCRLDTLMQATSQVATALETATASAQAGNDASCDKLLSALESAEVLSQRINPRQEDKELLERLYGAAHARLEEQLLTATGQAATLRPPDMDGLKRVINLGRRAQKLRLGAPRLSEGLGAAVSRMQLLEVEGQQHSRCMERCRVLGVPPPEEWPSLAPESVVALMEQVSAQATQQRVHERTLLHARLRAVESAAAVEERQHREECRAGQLRIVALQKALGDTEAARAHERAQAVQQQRANVSQLQECRSSEAALCVEVAQLRKEVEKRDRWLDRLALPGR